MDTKISDSTRLDAPVDVMDRVITTRIDTNVSNFKKNADRSRQDRLLAMHYQNHVFKQGS